MAIGIAQYWSCLPASQIGTLAKLESNPGSKSEGKAEVDVNGEMPVAGDQSQWLRSLTRYEACFKGQDEIKRRIECE